MKSDTLIEFDKVLKFTEPGYLDRARAYPFLKWAGGKRTLVPEIVRWLPPSFNDYYEPFVGGGALFFSLDSRIKQRAFLSDLNDELMLTYKMLQVKPLEVIRLLEDHHKKHSKDHYRRVRDKGHGTQDPVQLAARFIYLNKTCYNGLYRVNKSGKFNVPIGSYKNPKICDRENLLAVSQVLQNAVLKAQSFERIEPGPGDLIYCDPPYDETFTGYTKDGFGGSSQKDLRKSCDDWRKAGAHVIISNSNTDFIQSTWKGYDLHEVIASRNISCKVAQRKKVTELLIVGKPHGQS